MGDFDVFLTETFDLYRSNGTTLVAVSYNNLCSPLDPISDGAVTQAYPIDKLFSLREVFTEVTTVRNGDYIEVDGVRYAVKSSEKWDAMAGMGLFYYLVVEEQRGS